jgi:hypothetical protein
VLLRARLAFLLLALATGCSHSASPEAAAGDAAKPALDPTTLVIVHSWTGRTAKAGREIATMVNAQLIVAHDPISESMPRDGQPRVDDVLRSLQTGSVKRIYLGFPTWNEAPSAPAQHFVETAPLKGITVVPFYTYLHFMEPAKLDHLTETIRARGGAPTEPLALHVPLSLGDSQIACAARRALLQHTRPDFGESVQLSTGAPSLPTALGGFYLSGFRCAVSGG